MIGKLRHRIVIQNRTTAPDGMGGFTESWSTYATVWASIEPMSGAERFFSDKVEATSTHKVMIRSLDGLDSHMRFSLDDRVFQIKSVRNLDERNNYMELTAQEGVGS